MIKKRTLFISFLILFILLAGTLVYFVFKLKVIKEIPPQIPAEEKTLEEKLQSLTAPSGETPEVSKETLKSLTAPGGGEVSEDILKSLTAPQ